MTTGWYVTLVFGRFDTDEEAEASFAQSRDEVLAQAVEDAKAQGYDVTVDSPSRFEVSRLEYQAVGENAATHSLTVELCAVPD